MAPLYDSHRRALRVGVDRGVSLKSGVIEALPYSISRWTDVPIAKWSWFLAQLDQGWMQAFDPRKAMPYRWSLVPQDVLGLIFWTKNPAAILGDLDRLRAYRLRVHVTITGWTEAEPGAPDPVDVSGRTADLAEAIGWDHVVWRFSPVPVVPDALDRFERVGRVLAGRGCREVYLAFIQNNDMMRDGRAPTERVRLMRQMAAMADGWGLKVVLCNEDSTLQGVDPLPRNLMTGVCENALTFGLTPNPDALEGCGCALSVDPFTVNESCPLGCRYCYAADRSLSPNRRDTTSLPVLAGGLRHGE